MLESGISGRYVLRRRFPGTGDASSFLERDLRLWTAVLVVSLHDIISDLFIGFLNVKMCRTNKTAHLDAIRGHVFNCDTKTTLQWRVKEKNCSIEYSWNF